MMRVGDRKATLTIYKTNQYLPALQLVIIGNSNIGAECVNKGELNLIGSSRKGIGIGSLPINPYVPNAPFLYPLKT